MEYLLICGVATLVSTLTLFSGFGLGTMLMPAYALFFPLPVAVASTAVVHLANNIFKVILIGKNANWPVVFRFALPATLTAMIGAGLLTLFNRLPTLFSYEIGSSIHEVTIVKVVIGIVITFFAVLDLMPHIKKMSFDKKYLPLGGALSGFFGGLSGNQGALRSAFLIKAGLEKESFVGTGVVSAVIVDCARLLVYGAAFYSAKLTVFTTEMKGLVVAAIIAAFTGSFIGKRLLQKITLETVKKLVATMLIFIGLFLITGLI